MDEYSKYVERRFDELMASRAARGYRPEPSPVWLSDLVRSLPNHFINQFAPRTES